MITSETLEKTSDNFSYQRMLFKKEDFAFILNREKIVSRFNDFLTRAYYQRKRLVEEGFVGVCFTYKINYSENQTKNHRTFALFCPSKSIMVDESFFVRVIHNIEDLLTTKGLTYKQKKLVNYYRLVDAKPRYYKLDKSLTEGKIVYLQYIELISNLNQDLKPGLNYVLYAPFVSKELLYLPNKYIKQ